MALVQGISAVSPIYKSDAAVAADSRKPEPGAAAFTRAVLQTPSVDGSDESATFQEKVQMLFDGKVASGGPLSRRFEFNVEGVRGTVMEAGEGQLFIDFPQRGIGMLLKDGVCVPTGNASPRDVAAMRKATLLGLST